MAEESVDKLMAALLTLVPEQKEDANLGFFQVRESAVCLTLEAGT